MGSTNSAQVVAEATGREIWERFEDALAFGWDPTEDPATAGLTTAAQAATYWQEVVELVARREAFVPQNGHVFWIGPAADPVVEEAPVVVEFFGGPAVSPVYARFLGRPPEFIRDLLPVNADCRLVGAAEEARVAR